MATPSDDTPTITPNEAFRRVRQVYLLCIGIAIPLLFLAFYTTVENIGYGVLPIVLLIIGVGLLIFSMLTRAAASCPRCSTSLLWKKGPIGTGRISLGEKKRCPGCDLDLNAPWIPEPIEPTDGDGSTIPDEKKSEAT